MRITNGYAKHLAVCTLGEGERAMQVEGSDARDAAAARARVRERCGAYLRRHPEITSIEVFASKRHGGWTAEVWDRRHLLS